MSEITAEYLEHSLVKHLAHDGVIVNDLRGKLPSREPGWSKIDFDQRRGICFHHSASNNGSWESYARSHMARWSKAGTIAYIAGVGKDGSFNIFNDFDRKGYSQGDRDHPGDENAQLMGFLIDGSFHSRWNQTYVNPTYEQLKTIWSIIDFFDNNSPIRQIGGHFMFGKAACPGDMIKNMIIEYNVYHIETVEQMIDELDSDPSFISTIIQYINAYNVLDTKIITDVRALQRAIQTLPDGLFYSKSKAKLRQVLKERKEKFSYWKRT